MSHASSSQHPSMHENLSFLSSKETKVVNQRQYRKKEGECFTTLRDVITRLTGNEPQSRQEVLRKAIELLFKRSEMRRQEMQALPSVPDGSLYYDDATHCDGPTQSSYEHQTWPLNAEFTVPTTWYIPDAVNSGKELPLDLGIYQEYFENLSHYPNL